MSSHIKASEAGKPPSSPSQIQIYLSKFSYLQISELISRNRPDMIDEKDKKLMSMHVAKIPEISFSTWQLAISAG